MRIVTFSTLYPNARQPNHGVFVENRLRRLVETGAVSSKIVAPVPWFPFSHPRFGQYAAFAGVPRRERRHGLDILHPRYVVLPKVGMTLAPASLFSGTLPTLRRLARNADGFDLIDAHYFYPDGIAAVMLGAALGKPVVITARGTDLNLVPRHLLPRRMIQAAAARASGLITVSQALKDALVDLGVDARRVRVLRNGVDLDLFKPTDRDAARRKLAVDGRILLSVGLLIPRKGHDIIIRALPEMPGCTLLIAGEGPERDNLTRLAQSHAVGDRVRFLGAVPHGELPAVYEAADALVLASSREGWANVLLESMACGTPVAASSIWGNPEVVSAPAAGVLMRERTPEGVTEAVGRLFANPPTRAATRAYAEGFGWEPTTAGQISLFREILADRCGASSVRGDERPIERA